MRREGWQRGWVFNKNSNDFMYVKKPQKALMSHLAKKQQRQMKSAPARRKNNRARDGNSELYDWSVCRGRRGFPRGSRSAVEEALFGDVDGKAWEKVVVSTEPAPVVPYKLRFSKVILEIPKNFEVFPQNDEEEFYEYEGDSSPEEYPTDDEAFAEWEAQQADKAFNDQAFAEWEAEVLAIATGSTSGAFDPDVENESTLAAFNEDVEDEVDDDVEDEDDDDSWSWSSVSAGIPDCEEEEFVEVTADDWV